MRTPISKAIQVQKRVYSVQGQPHDQAAGLAQVLSREEDFGKGAEDQIQPQICGGVLVSSVADSLFFAELTLNRRLKFRLSRISQDRSPPSCPTLDCRLAQINSKLCCKYIFIPNFIHVFLCACVSIS